MSINTSKINRKLLWLLVISSIMEKYVWRIGGLRLSLFQIVGIMIVLYSFASMKLVIWFKNDSALIFYTKVFLMAFSILQFVFISKNEAILDQYFKGIIEIVLNFLIMYCSIGLVYNETWDADYKFEFIHMMGVAGRINIVYCLIQFFYHDLDLVFIRLVHSEVTRYGVDEYGTLGRLTGLFTDSNNNGVFIVITFIIFLFEITNCETKVKKIYYICFEVLAGIILILTFSRTAWVGFVVFLFVYFWDNGAKTQLKLLSLGVLGIIGLIVVYYTNEAVAAIINSKLLPFTQGNISLDSHFVLLIDALLIWRMNITTVFIGTGINCLSVYYESEFGLVNYKAHSYYLQNLAEMGIVGFVIVILFFFAMLRLIKCLSSQSRKLGKAIVFPMLFMNITYDSMVQPMFVIIIVLMCYLYFMENRIDFLDDIIRME